MADDSSSPLDEMARLDQEAGFHDPPGCEALRAWGNAGHAEAARLRAVIEDVLQSDSLVLVHAILRRAVGS